jgi:TIR domain
MDIDTIPVGLDFREHLQQSLQRCDILLAIVGPRWLGTDDHGHHAIADETDWVRIEIETALLKKIPVIPVLIDRLRMPKATELPESLRNFAFRQAAEVDSGLDFRSHLERLIRSMDQYLQGQSASPSTSPAAPIQKPDTQVPDAKENRTERAPNDGVAPVAKLPLPSPSLHAAVTIGRFVTHSSVGIVSVLVVSELLALLSERAAADNSRLLFILFSSLPLGAIGLISIGLRLFAYLKSGSDITGAELAIAVLGVLLVATVPTFFHVTHPPDQYVAAAAWPLVLLGGLGLVLISTVLISHSVSADRPLHSMKGWVAFAIILLALAWLASNPTSAYLSMLHWRVRSVLIFTCVFVGSVMLAVIASCAVLQFASNNSVGNVGGK